MKPLTKREVRAVITQFNDYNAGKAPIKAFEEIVDAENLYIRMRGTEIDFRGLTGFADHQTGKTPFFDQRFTMTKCEPAIKGGRAKVKTAGRWYARTWAPPAAFSHQLIADLRHTWEVFRCPATGRAKILGHVCEHLKYLPGHGPEDPPKDFHFTVGK